MKIHNSKTAQDADRKAIENYIPGILLMERAASNIYMKLIENYGSVKNKKIIVVCGTGNNGGDGFAVARYLFSDAEVSILVCGDTEKITGDAKINYEICKKMGMNIVESFDRQYDIVIDALFGTGLSRNIDGEYAEIIKKINDSGSYIVSVDIPSGLSADTGKICGTAVIANLTVTFHRGKAGHFIYPGRQNTGKLEITDIGIIENDIYGNLNAVNSNDIKLKDRNPVMHKGDSGKVLIIGGSVGMSGAVCMAASGALRAGAGLITVAIPKSIATIVASKNNEIMTLPLSENEDGTISLKAIQEILEYISKTNPDCVVIGPGMGRNINTIALARKLIDSIKCTKIIDADALYAIKDDAAALKNKRCILTPHMGEFERMSNLTENKIEDALNFAKRTGTVLVLKGADTITTNGENVFINTSGNPGMAVGGMGDILAGIIGSLSAQGYGEMEAAYYGVYLHGYCADILEKEIAQESITPTGIVEIMGKAIKELKAERGK